MKILILLIFVIISSCSTTKEDYLPQVNKKTEDPIHEYYRKLRSSSQKDIVVPKSYLQWKYGKPTRRRRIKPKSFRAPTPAKNYKAIIDQKLAYFCFVKRNVENLGSEQKCQNFIKNTYKVCLTKSENDNSKEFVDCITQHLNI